MDNELIDLASRLGLCLKAKGVKVATAESCTGGWIAQAITEIPGSSTWFDRGFVSYSNESKVQMLGVDEHALARYGAVSAEVAQQMVSGALDHSDAHVAIAVTGIAGPGGGGAEKPVGTVYVAWQNRGKTACIEKLQLFGNRNQVRYQTVLFALQKGLFICDYPDC
jgi:nicotinamide-nucleotide amidase